MKQNLIFDETEQVFTMDFGELHQVGSNITVDQNYTPESENAQSGKAVAEALEPIQASIKLIEGEKAGISYVDNEITGVKTALNDKANKDHTHADKADKNHTHADIEEGLTDAHARINELNNNVPTQQQVVASSNSSSNSSSTVYANGGSSKSNKYHKSANAHNMKGAIPMSEDQAKSNGYVACKKCY